VSQPSPGFSRWKSFVLCAGSGCGLLQPNPSPVDDRDSTSLAAWIAAASLPSIEDVGMVITVSIFTSLFALGSTH